MSLSLQVQRQVQARGISPGAEESELLIRNVYKTGHRCSKGTSGDGKM